MALLLLAGAPAPVFDAVTQVEAQQAYGQLPLAFERNRGQGPARFDFLARSGAGTAAISGRGARISPASRAGSQALALRLRGAEATAPEPVSPLPGKVNHLVGDDPREWRTGIPTYEGVRYRAAYPGIDVVWHGDRSALEYDFRLAPHADPDRIAVRVGGAKDLRIAGDGDLVIDLAGHELRQLAPYAYQEVDGGRRAVPVRYQLEGNSVRFALGRYDGSRPLTIDPVVLAYSTYLGGGGIDRGNAIAIDAQGAAYVAGESDSDVFVSKLTPDGSALEYSTRIGGGADDAARGIAVDSQGSAYVTGETDSTDFDTVGPIEGDSAGTDAFVAKLDPQGSALTYSTYLGGDASDLARSIAVDSQGSAYVTGETDSTDFDTVGPIEGDSAGTDAFVAKLAPQGSALTYSTYLGGDAADVARGIALDRQGSAYVTGETDSSDFDRVGGIEGDSAGTDAFVSKLSASGSALGYSTYLGGGGADAARTVAVDSDGAAHVAGSTSSSDFDTVSAIEGDSPGTDAFVTKLTPSGLALGYSTYLGGDDVDEANGIALDPAGAAYVAGRTNSIDFDVLGGIEADSDGHRPDAFVSKLSPSGSALGYSTYLGGSNLDLANGIAADADGAAYVAGTTDSTNFDTVRAVQGNQPGTDAFAAKLIGPADLALSKSDSQDPVREGGELRYVLTVVNNGPQVAVDVRVDDVLPAGVVFVSAPAGCTETGGVVTCELGSLGLDQSETIEIVVRPTVAGLLTNAAAASSANFDPNQANSSAEERTNVLAAPLCEGRHATIVGTNVPETIHGTSDDDVIVALGGDDEIFGEGGDDRICTGPGDDTALGGSGLDRITDAEDQSRDLVRGQGDDDEITVGPAPDRVKGGSGDDHVVDTGFGADELRGGSGDDEFEVSGDPALDLRGGDGADVLMVLSLSTSAAIDLGSGSDELSGRIRGNDISGGDGGDRLEAHPDVEAVLEGDAGDDRLSGSFLHDELRGNRGGDVIEAGGGPDVASGGAGPDEIDAGAGNDRERESGGQIRGGPGEDELRGGDGRDELFGEAGTDELAGQDGNDDLDGGRGSDFCDGGTGSDSSTSCEEVEAVP